ncbi:hypothetical protein AVEN_118758-1 [Araneus ventricosus]|uniref:Uncharacterized protein n=1 Tax=Araneus ventricosus TaxID=182803 RepID=A0A4Y2BXL4_ARAVE|nr:hypothetical protein AVEN_118758-1 [Araneus ventricosus]
MTFLIFSLSNRFLHSLFHSSRNVDSSSSQTDLVVNNPRKPSHPPQKTQGQLRIRFCGRAGPSHLLGKRPAYFLTSKRPTPIISDTPSSSRHKMTALKVITEQPV